MAEGEAVQLNVSVWHDDLREVFGSSELGAGALALVQIVMLQLDQAKGMVDGLSGDVFVERGLGTWKEDYDASFARIVWIADKLRKISESSDGKEVKLAAVYNFVARPILDGLYPKEMLDELPTFAKRNITAKSDGGGEGVGEAYASATLWNQAAVAGQFDNAQSNDWLSDRYREILSEAIVKIQTSAPGETPTWGDATVKVIEKIKEGADALIEPIASALMWIGIGVGVIVFGGVVYYIYRATQK
jgi:hypothetical protein